MKDSSELSIKVVIAGRTYPLTINRAEEEEIRKAAKKINEAIKVLQENYAVRDTQDLLAMVALQIATQKDKGSESNGTESSELLNSLSFIESKITSYLED